MDQEEQLFLLKATESVEGAEGESANSRFNNAANRCYYATFQAAIAALIRANVRPAAPQTQWGHEFVQAQFNGQLVHRRKLYPAELREVFERSYALRVTADYSGQQVSSVQVERILRRVKAFVDVVAKGGGG